MTPPDEGRGSLTYRLGQVEDQLASVNKKLDEQGKALARLEPLPGQVSGLSKRAGWVLGVIVASAIGFAFSVLALVPV